MSDLDVLGVLCGTDKSSAHESSWDYLRHFDRLFRDWKLQSINIIEIGILGGSSIEMWLQYFEKATIVAIDINSDCARFTRDRVVVKIGSQENPEFLQSVANQYPPTIVIDDGSHLAHQMIASFEALFPALAPGGIYIFEDLAFHFEDGVGQWLGAKAHQGASEKTIYEYLAPFLRARLANISTPRGSWGFARYAFENIDCVTAIGGALAVHKRAPRSFEQDISTFEALLPTAKDIDAAQQRYASYLIRHNVHSERAYDLLKNTLSKRPDALHLLELMYIVTVRLGRLEEALEYAEKIAAQRPELTMSWQRIAELQRRLNHPNFEVQALRSVVRIDENFADAHRRLSVLYEQVGDLDQAQAAARKVCDLSPADHDAANRVRMLGARRPRPEG